MCVELAGHDCTFRQLDGDLPIAHVNGASQQLGVTGDPFPVDEGLADVAGRFRIADLKVTAESHPISHSRIVARFLSPFQPFQGRLQVAFSVEIVAVGTIELAQLNSLATLFPEGPKPPSDLCRKTEHLALIRVQTCADVGNDGKAVHAFASMTAASA